MNWWKVGIGIVIVGALGWFGWYVTRPVPGSRMEDQGREHVSASESASFRYNSNPPTSGSHLATWVKAGIFDTMQSEGELLHSLEHGYVVISYNCSAVESDGCKTLVKQLTELANKKKLWKLIVAPRPQLDTTIALTAWTYIDKFDPDPIGVDQFNEGRIERFIDYHRDQGPEKTME